MFRSRPAGFAFIVILAVLALSGAFDWALDMAFNPWARANPSLFGAWTGSLTTGTGERLIVWLEMHRALTEGDSICLKCAQIEGSAATCDTRGAVLRYRISGSPSDRQASRVHIGAQPERQPPPDGLELDTLIGTWDGANALALQADFVWRRGGASISSTDDKATQPVPLPMKRDPAKGFETMCGRHAPY